MGEWNGTNISFMLMWVAVILKICLLYCSKEKQLATLLTCCVSASVNCWKKFWCEVNCMIIPQALKYICHYQKIMSNYILIMWSSVSIKHKSNYAHFVSAFTVYFILFGNIHLIHYYCYVNMNYLIINDDMCMYIVCLYIIYKIWTS